MTRPALTPAALTPADIAAMLRLPAPTAEQEAVITAPLRPGVVIAGAGSGKTETMAARVVWLVANRRLDPAEVLGLTFTRKAAGELGVRVRHRLQAVAAALRWSGLEGEPTISTYDAFAAQVVTEHGARLGIEPDRRLLSPAAAWQRAARLVHRWDGAMEGVDAAPDTLVADLLDLHEQAAGHLADLDDVRAVTERLLTLIESLPPGPGQKLPVASRLVSRRRAQRTRLALLPLVAEYRRLLRADDVADFATIAAEAAWLARADPSVGSSLRSQYRVVLLDEYQDTSHAQLALLHAAFGPGHALTAVGDPFQSIYGWRGANADTLASFAERFAADEPVDELTLSTSFRNARIVLDLANHVAGPLRAGRHHVTTLVPAPAAPRGTARLSLHRTAADEAAAVAAEVAAAWHAPRGAADPPSVAVLVRRRDQIPLLEEALRVHDLPIEVVGLDGLLSLPEVADVVALLRLVADPARGDAFMRLLTGPQLGFGPRDLDRLVRWARRLAEPRTDDAVPAWQHDRPGIVETLEHLPPPGWLSPPAAARLRRFATAVGRVRSRLSRPLTDVVSDAIRALRLDVETHARACRTGGVGTAHLERLVDEAAGFAELAPQAGLQEFLGYLAAAEQQERGLRRAVEVHRGSRIQLLTVHAAKGLEWDVVAVTGLSDGVFPSSSRAGAAWAGDAGTLPYPLRGDAARLPPLDLAGPDDQKALVAEVEAFVVAGRALDLEEERRLAYVAVTRARQVLLCHGHRWGSATKPKEPSPFLVGLTEVDGVVVERWEAEPGAPPDAGAAPPVWPGDLLGRHRPAIEEGAALVRAAMAAASEPYRGGGRPAQWAAEVDVLLAERSAASAGHAVPPPAHLSASHLVALRRDPQRFLADLRRPMPSRPRPEARRGTAFHAWVEQLYGNPQLLDLDELPGAADALETPAAADIEALQQAFRAAGWADRTPREVEAPFELVLDETVVRGRADAVFDDGDGVLVVDWKTGSPPTDPAEIAARSVQLAVYRLAFATLYGRPVDQVRAAFHHVREGLTISGVDLADADQLRALLRDVRSGATVTG
jgi:DNA helicase II / ATP-dependent DNA helicase PcrA